MIKITKIYGNIEGLKRIYIDRIQLLYDYHCENDQMLNPELGMELSAISGQINREVAVYIDRRGQVVDVLVGDVGTVSLEAVEGRRGENRLSGIRCIHTHPGGTGMLSSVDITAMKLLRLDAMVAIGVLEGEPADIYIGFIKPESRLQSINYIIEGPYDIKAVNHNNFMLTIKDIEKELSEYQGQVDINRLDERAILVGLQRSSNDNWDIKDSLKELAQLAETAGVKVLGNVVQSRPKPDVTYFVGQGKAKELNLLRQSHEANVVIFDDELSPAQLRNLEQIIGAKVIDRTALILDIFAQRARTKEGKLQVELAQLNYLLPRLTGQGVALSRLGGGIGTRGPGETKLEVDRRRIRKRISDLEREIDQIRKNRELQRQSRKTMPLPIVALVGYTNAGKSTLLNKLTNSDVYAEDKLFATLDPTTRKITLPSNQTLLLTDTVGFIQKLPHHLVVAFRATLEEITEADLLLHVVDASHPNFQEQMNAVNDVLRQLKVIDKPIIIVFNKIDKVNQDEIISTEAPVQLQSYISAYTGHGIESLMLQITDQLPNQMRRVQLKVPYSEGATLALVHREAKVISEEYDYECINIVADINKIAAQQIERYIVRSDGENED